MRQSKRAYFPLHISANAWWHLVMGFALLLALQGCSPARYALFQTANSHFQPTYTINSAQNDLPGAHEALSTSPALQPYHLLPSQTAPTRTASAAVAASNMPLRNIATAPVLQLPAIKQAQNAETRTIQKGRIAALEPTKLRPRPRSGLWLSLLELALVAGAALLVFQSAVNPVVVGLFGLYGLILLLRVYHSVSSRILLRRIKSESTTEQDRERYQTKLARKQRRIVKFLWLHLLLFVAILGVGISAIGWGAFLLYPAIVFSVIGAVVFTAFNFAKKPSASAIIFYLLVMGLSVLCVLTIGWLPVLILFSLIGLIAVAFLVIMGTGKWPG